MRSYVQDREGLAVGRPDSNLTRVRQDRYQKSLDLVLEWVRSRDYKAYEPADGNSSIFYPLTGGRVAPMRVIQQVVLRSPINIRPLMGVRPHGSAIGRGYLAWALTKRAQRTHAPATRAEAKSCFDWLLANRARGYDDYCWGDPYEYATRSGRRPHGEPILIWCSLIGLAFLDAFEAFGNEHYLEVAKSIGRWVVKLPREQTDRGCCLSYVAYRQSSIHNASIMGGAFLARLGALTGDAECVALATEAMRYTCARQLPDGAWWYAEEPKYHWIDNFHTGYNLSAIGVYRRALGDAAFDRELSLGLQYFKASFFEADGRPKYFHDRLYPVDIQCAAQAIETLLSFSAEDVDCLTLGLSVADWTIANLQAADGHFQYRDLGWTKVNTPMLHWGQGTMAKALAVALDVLGGSEQGRNA